ncbi:MAG: T9SS type A sorting domain-containing protein, partial [Bacteroidota bacterium]
PIYSNVGIIGGSNGGCNLLAALGLYSEYFSSLAWVSFFESPIGDGMLTADPGKPYGHAVSIFKNNSYNDSTGIFNWDAFKFAPDSVAYKQGNTVIKGLFYFDVNNNGIFNRGIDYDVIGKYNSPYSQKYYYSQQIVQHAYEKGYYPLLTTSNYFADSTQTKSYWNLRNGDNFINTIMPNMPNLKVLFMVRDDSDHITSAPNHPEVLNTWNKFSTAGCNWFRVNSDKAYIEYVTGLTLPSAPDNDANIPLDNLNIRTMLMPGNIFSDRYMNHYASTLEMADRVMNNNWSPNLSGILSVTCPSASKEEEEEIAADDQPTLYPNPSSGETFIQVNASEYGKSTIRVFDAIGREVLQPQTETVLKGFNLLILDINKLSAGNYFVRIDAPGVTHTLQFTRE